MTGYEDFLLNNRKKNGVPNIERISKEKLTFLGVGAAHLLGGEGVPNLLR
ncbi:TraB/GumN family protein [Flavobacterium sp. SM2513]